jgi:peroxiredoxin
MFAPAPPDVGTKAPSFSLMALDGTRVTLASELAHGPVVLILGRGWPGYQCPFCTKQFADFRSRAKDIEAAGARVLWIYPGPSEGLAGHAEAFVSAKDVPANFRLLVDPGYTFTLAYGLRWDAPSETAYPATFVVDRSGIVRFAQISRGHGGRTPAADVVTALAALGAPRM